MYIYYLKNDFLKLYLLVFGYNCYSILCIQLGYYYCVFNDVFSDINCFQYNIFEGLFCNVVIFLEVKIMFIFVKFENY